MWYFWSMRKKPLVLRAILIQYVYWSILYAKHGHMIALYILQYILLYAYLFICKHPYLSFNKYKYSYIKRDSKGETICYPSTSLR